MFRYILDSSHLHHISGHDVRMEARIGMRCFQKGFVPPSLRDFWRDSTFSSRCGLNPDTLSGLVSGFSILSLPDLPIPPCWRDIWRNLPKGEAFKRTISANSQDCSRSKKPLCHVADLVPKPRSIPSSSRRISRGRLCSGRSLMAFICVVHLPVPPPAGQRSATHRATLWAVTPPAGCAILPRRWVSSYHVAHIRR